MNESAELILDADPPRDEWLKARKSGLGSSDASALAGVNPWNSRLSVWLDKTSDTIDEKPPSRAMRLGNYLEEAVASLFSHETGKTVEKIGLLRSRKWPFMLASCDRYLPEENAILECKTTAWHQTSEWENDEVPDHALVQVIHQLAVTGLDRAYVAVLIGGGTDFQIRTVERDEAAIAGLVEISHDFWHNYVLPRVEPTASQQSDFNIVASLRPPVEDKVIPASDRLGQWLTERSRLRKQLTELQRQYMTVSAQIIQELGGATAATNLEGETLCTYREIKRQGYTVQPAAIRQLKLTSKGREYFNG